MKTNQFKPQLEPAHIGFIVSQFHYYAHAMEFERFTESERQFLILYYLNLKELLDSFKIAHRLLKFDF